MGRHIQVNCPHCQKSMRSDTLKRHSKVHEKERVKKMEIDDDGTNWE